MAKNKWWNAFAQASALETEVAPLQPVIELFGNERVLIENHHGVCKYSCEEISVRMKYGILTVRGAGLNIAVMTKQRLVICGKIRGISICERK